MSTTPNNSGAAGSHLHVEEQQLPKGVGKGKNKRWRIKKLLSFGAIFICLLLIIAAIVMHVRQKNHLGRLNYNYQRSTEHGELVLPPEVVTPPAVAALRIEEDGPSDECLDCIATTATENKPVMCSKGPCGVFRIYPAYWKDAVSAVPPAFASHSYESCVSNNDCSTELVRGYIKLYARDCNQDAVISCRDHIMLHHLGPTGCLTKKLQTPFRERMNECLRVKMLE